MGEIKKIVVEAFPVERLPEELRQRLVGQASVRVTLETDTAEPRPLSEFYGCAKGLYADQGIDPTEFIRDLRNEWTTSRQDVPWER